MERDSDVDCQHLFGARKIKIIRVFGGLYCLAGAESDCCGGNVRTKGHLILAIKAGYRVH